MAPCGNPFSAGPVGYMDLCNHKEKRPGVVPRRLVY